MNCREAQHQLFAEGDGAPDNTRRAALDGHVAHCADCRRIRDDLAAALATWRRDVENVAVPDAEREWHAVRRRMRGGVEAGAERPVRPRRNLLAWLALPVGAAAALAVALLDTSPRPHGGNVAPAQPQVARADALETPGNNSSTMMFVDDKSGWLIVWASDAPKSG